MGTIQLTPSDDVATSPCSDPATKRPLPNETFLQTVYQQFNTLGLADTQDEFSRLCGRTPTWYSSLKARRLPMSTAAAITLHTKLGQQISAGMPRRLRPLARAVRKELLQFARNRSLQTREHGG